MINQISGGMYMKKTLKIAALFMALTLSAMTLSACGNNDSGSSEKTSFPDIFASESAADESKAESVEEKSEASQEASSEASQPVEESKQEIEDISEDEPESQDEPEPESDPEPESQDEPESEPEPSSANGKSIREALEGTIGLNTLSTMLSQQYENENMSLSADYSGDDEIVFTMKLNTPITPGTSEYETVVTAMNQYLNEQSATMSQSIESMKTAYGVRDFKMTFNIYTSDGTLITSRSYS